MVLTKEQMKYVSQMLMGFGLVFGMLVVLSILITIKLIPTYINIGVSLICMVVTFHLKTVFEKEANLI